MRKADKRLGDDPTLTRWVPLDTRHAAARKPTAPMPADATGTRFRARVLAPTDMGGLLVSGHSNVKIGRDVRIGRLKGYWIYTLSLEERATCPSSCAHWTDCYGNSMPFGKRIDHTHPEFLPMLEAEIGRLLAVRGREGVLVRLHALGDFYSTDYVRFWQRMLDEHENLAIFGYTAHPITSEIGSKVHRLFQIFGLRALIRHSDAGYSQFSTVSVDAETVRVPDAFKCPNQQMIHKKSGELMVCATCALCWSTPTNVAFQGH
jgi:hypothetical protein